jgi:hypothetical protein
MTTTTSECSIFIRRWSVTRLMAVKLPLYNIDRRR